MMPSPNASESQAEFIARFMADAKMMAEFPDEKQRAAVAHSAWEKGSAMHGRIALRGARGLGSAIESPTEHWMFAPGGVHTITLGAGEGAATVTLRVDETTAVVLQASLQNLNAKNAPQKVFFDKEHDERAGATAWPKRFLWASAPQPGVYVEHEPSTLGRELVEGKVMRAFSPSFHADADLPKRIGRGQHVEIAAGRRGSPENPARMTGLVYPAAGTLTNDPAFRKILPLWAKHAGANASGNPKTKQQMNKLTAEELAALQAKKTTLEQDLIALRAQDQSAAIVAEQLQAKETELQATEAQLEAEALRARNETLEENLVAQRTKDAAEAVKAAVKRGAIPLKDEALQAKWQKRLVEDPEAIELLASMKGSPALERPQRLVLSGVQITREDSATVLKAYAAEKDPRKKGDLYARELSKRIKDREELPLRATNTLGTLSGELVTQNALELLTLEQPAIAALSTDFSAEAAKLNQEITTRIVGIPGTTAYNTSTGYATENTLTTDVSVTITTHKSCQLSFNVEELASTPRKMFEEFAPAMAYAIGKDIIDIALALITTSNFTETPTTEALIDFDRSTVVGIAGALSDRGVPMNNRTLLLTGSYYDKLFSDETIVLLAANQRADLITGSRMIPLHDFSVMRAPTLPSTGNLTGFGFSRSALVVAGRVPSDYRAAFPNVSGGGVSQVITNPQSGLSVMLTQFINDQLGAAFSRLAYMFGAAKGQVKAGQILRSSA